MGGTPAQLGAMSLIQFNPSPRHLFSAWSLSSLRLRSRPWGRLGCPKPSQPFQNMHIQQTPGDFILVLEEVVAVKIFILVRMLLAPTVRIRVKLREVACNSLAELGLLLQNSCPVFPLVITVIKDPMTCMSDDKVLQTREGEFSVTKFANEELRRRIAGFGVE